MNTVYLNSFASLLALAGFLNITDPIMAMDDKEGGHTMRVSLPISTGNEPENSENTYKQLHSQIEQGDIYKALEILKTPSTYNEMWILSSQEVERLPVGTLKTMDLDSIRVFREALQTIPDFTRCESEKGRLNEHLRALVVLEAFVQSLQAEDEATGLKMAHQVLEEEQDDLIRELALLPLSLREGSVEQLYQLFTPVFERMMALRTFNDTIMNDFMYKVFRLPYDENRIWYDKAADLLARVPEGEKIGEGSDRMFTSNDASFWKVMLAFYNREKDSTIRTMLWEDTRIGGDASSLDSEDLPMFIRAIAYRGVDNLEPETRVLLQTSILDENVGNEWMPSECRETLQFESTLQAIFARADREKKEK